LSVVSVGGGGGDGCGDHGCVFGLFEVGATAVTAPRTDPRVHDTENEHGHVGDGNDKTGTWVVS